MPAAVSTDSPTSGADAFVNQSAYLLFGQAVDSPSATTITQTNTYNFTELYSWSINESIERTVTPFGSGQHISYASAPMDFSFACWGSHDLSDRLERAFGRSKVKTADATRDAVPKLSRFHLKIVTEASLAESAEADRVHYLNFTGRIRSLATSRQGGQGARVAIACSVDLQDENYIATTQLAPIPATVPGDGRPGTPYRTNTHTF